MSAATPGVGDTRRVVVGASLVFAAVLSVLAWVLWRLRGVSPADVFDPAALPERVSIGIAIGLAAGAACLGVVNRLRVLGGLRRLACEAIDGIEPRWHTVAIIAAAAGWSEEVFFRGALEPAVGRAISTVAFVGLHGALRIRGRGSLAFAVFLGAASLGLSSLCAWKGVETAMAAHASYDLAVLAGLIHGARARPLPD